MMPFYLEVEEFSSIAQGMFHKQSTSSFNLLFYGFIYDSVGSCRIISISPVTISSPLPHY